MCVGFTGNGTSPRCYINEVVVNAANTWEYKTVTFPADTSSPTSWEVGSNSLGGWLWFCLGAGASQNDATAGSWQARGDDATAAQSNFFATPNNTIYLANVMLLPGNKAPSSIIQPLLQRISYQQELVELQRYYWRHQTAGTFVMGAAQATNTVVATVRFPQIMRGVATVAAGGTWGFNFNGTPSAMSAVGTNAATRVAAQMYGTLTPVADYIGEGGRVEGQNSTAYYVADARM
jgi:hypothetical protein